MRLESGRVGSLPWLGASFLLLLVAQHLIKKLASRQTSDCMIVPENQSMYFMHHALTFKEKERSKIRKEPGRCLPDRERPVASHEERPTANSGEPVQNTYQQFGHFVHLCSRSSIPS